jgi:undecaprenyl-diphosphatase
MIFLSAKWVWLPLYGVLLFLLYRKYGNHLWVYLTGILLSILLADQLTSLVMKPHFARLRPCHEESLQDYLMMVNRCGGSFGFASSHAANTFALAVFFTKLFRHPGYYLLWLWALMISYSRIYLGAHYPGDVLVGGLLGGVLGYLCYRLSHYFYHRLIIS